MKLSGWIFMISSWAFILWLMVYSYEKVLKRETPERTEKPRRSKKEVS